MEEPDVNRAMMLIAISTVVVGALILTVGKITAEDAEIPFSPKMKRNAIILMLAGPVSWGLWHAFNGLLQGVGYRSVVGYVLAAVVFVGAGFLTGLFSRLWGRRAPEGSEDEQEHKHEE